MTFLGETEHFGGKIGVLRWIILMRNKSILMYKSVVRIQSLRFVGLNKNMSAPAKRLGEKKNITGSKE